MKKRLYINDVVTTKFGQARIKSIDLYEVHAMVGDPISVKSVWSTLKFLWKLLVIIALGIVMWFAIILLLI